jgi:hypothetical protein
MTTVLLGYSLFTAHPLTTDDLSWLGLFLIALICVISALMVSIGGSGRIGRTGRRGKDGRDASRSRYGGRYN